MKLKTQFKTALLAAALMASSTGFAGMVNNWSYVTSLEFTDSSFNDYGVGGEYADGDELSWGEDGGTWTTADGGRSALTIGGNLIADPTDTSGTERTIEPLNTVSGVVATGGAGIGNSMTHWNRTISLDWAVLDSGTLEDKLTLTALDGAMTGVSKNAPTLEIGFGFEETLNYPGPGNCVTGDTPCADVWGIVGVQTTGIDFIFDSWLYEIDIVIVDPNDLNTSPIEQLTADQCAVLGFDPNDPCFGFITPEKQVTSVQFGFTIESVGQVPVPAAVWLFGSALLGFVGYNRRRKSKA